MIHSPSPSSSDTGSWNTGVEFDEAPPSFFEGSDSRRGDETRLGDVEVLSRGGSETAGDCSVSER